MPVVSAPLPEVDQNITRPAILDIVRQIKDLTGIPADVSVNFIAQGEARTQYGSTVESQDDTTRIASGKMVTIEVEEQYDEGFFATNAGHRPEQLPDFCDNRLGIFIKPIYATCNYEINFTYKTPSRNEALRWRDDAHFNASQMRDVNMHELTYHYLLPDPFWTLLRHLYDMREAQAGYGQTFDEYVMDHLTTRATQLTSQNGEKQRTAIRETQMRVQGFFDFQAEPQKQEKNTEKGNWEVHFTYRFSFSKPIKSAMHYPVVVHNQLIDEKFIPTLVIDHERVQARMGLSTNALHYFEAPQMQQRLVGEKLLRYSPSCDEWTPDTTPPNTSAHLSLLVGADTAAAGVLLSLDDIGEYTLSEDVLAFIKATEYQWVNKLHASLIQVSVYKDTHLVRYDRFSVTSDLKVTLHEPLNLRSTYRVLISFCNDITKVHPRAIRRLLPYPNALQKLVRATGPSRGQLRRLLPEVDIEQYFMDLPDGGYSRQEITNSIVSMKTVQLGYAEAVRRDVL